ncbi:MAG TPA: D-aminoacylase [Cyclobacteriaceae bacterium]|nr:D-aminoacylase [Cyclobacteriaceae bacterium]
MKTPLSSLLLVAILVACQKPHYDTIIRGAIVIDGTGSPGQVMDVAIKGDSIAATGDLTKAEADHFFDAKGLVLAPGFIDAHSHHDWGMEGMRDMPACLSQGITTIVVGQDGSSHLPLRKFFAELDQQPVAVNVASYAGHNTIRDSAIVQSYARFSSPQEIQQMKEMLAEEMDAGALGLSTGLEYDPGIYAHPDEVVELAKVASGYGGRYISHIRSEDRYFWKAINEIIRIGREAKLPVQISHGKLAMRSLWGKSAVLFARLDSARTAGIEITADVYPYTYWHSSMTVLFPGRNFKDRKEAELALTEITTPEGVLMDHYSLDTTYGGKTLVEIARLRKADAPKTLMDLIAEVESKQGDASIIATSMQEEDIRAWMSWPHTVVGSDGSGVGRHPRGYGAFTKVLRQYVREEKVFTLEQAIHKMTAQTADQLNIPKRGRIAIGQYADLVLFDPAAVTDRSTTKKPQLRSAGIDGVWVNGQLVWQDNKPTAAYAGRPLRHQIR